MIGYLLVIGAAFAVSCASMPFLQRLSFRIGAVVHPDARRVHAHPTAVLGGAGIVAGVLVGFAVAWLSGQFAATFRTIAQPLGVVLAAVTIYVVGQLDDLREVSAPAKTAGSVLAGSILAIAGLTIVFFRIPFVGLVALAPDLATLITVLWVVGMAQAVNLLDGLDGLAAGVVAIAAGAILMFAEFLDNNDAIIRDDNIGALIAACVLGACIGYLPWNFHPAKLFMGDAGALTLGVLMAAATIAIGGNTDAEVRGQTFFFFAPLFLPLVILGVPILDTAWALLRRARGRAGLTIADKGHLHHRLLRLGHGHRRTVLVLWAWTGLLSTFVLIPVYTGEGTSFLPLGVLALGLFLFTVFGPGMLAKRNGEPEDVAASVPPAHLSSEVTRESRAPASARRGGGA
ncbi:MAG TPA: MraY family glycosyltransferase [Acidimicrobiales bacterium]|jgi:UDP-GlcNAc:undecaprenyl-phosphate GlcNAc-1-phosphate transferase|nr:MraY family glycosyltransferase [Acidimicrobiales bacterium]